MHAPEPKTEAPWMHKNTILIIDDDPHTIAALKRVLFEEPYEIYSADNALKGLELLQKHATKIIISDEKMPGLCGTQFLCKVRLRFPNVIRIMLTGHASVDSALKAINEGEIYRFFTKPWNDMDLRLALRSAIDKYDLEEENRRLITIIKQQALDLKLLEKQFPGITKLNRDERGRLILPEVSEGELEQIIKQCEKDFN